MSTSTGVTAPMDRLGRALVESAPDGIVYADGDGIIGFWNSGAERLFGFAAAEAVGHRSTSLSPCPSATGIGTAFDG